MTSQMTATELKAKLLAVLDDVARGDTVEITKRGKPVAMLTPPAGSRQLRGRVAGVAVSNADEDQLFTTGTNWNAQ